MRAHLSRTIVVIVALALTGSGVAVGMGPSRQEGANPLAGVE